MFQVLESIPGIHATIAGILTAFFSAYFMYAYQRVTEAQRKLERALKIAKFVSTPDYYVVHNSALIDENGNLDWDGKCKDILHEAVCMFSHLDMAEYEMVLVDSGRKIDQKEIDRIVEGLETFFSLFFIKYPMTGGDEVGTRQTANNTFDYQRYSEIERRISRLMFEWNTCQQSLIHLFNLYDENKEKEAQAEMQREIERLLQDSSIPSEHQKGMDRKAIKMVQASYHRRVQNKKSTNLINFFHKIQIYNAQVIPVLDEAINEFDSFNNELKVKEVTKIALITAIIVMITGIIIPLIFLKIVNKFNKLQDYILTSYFEYFVLILSFMPYFVICFFMFNKIKSMNFK